MPPVLLAGIVIVNCALLSYALGILLEQRTHRVSAWALNWLKLGVVLDITATACMIAGSSRGFLTPHGLLGFSSLAAMLVETGFAWRHRSQHGDRLTPRWLHNYSRIAYGWWLIAYVTGAYLVMSAA
ncbi:MAG: hypothetical protein OES47_12170 [Acidobacteriota bacterium]|nr:hypothetical protein [Acidobacteriota bacterium]